MQTTTDRYDAGIVGSHRVAVTADIYYNRVPYLQGLAVATGTVTLDRTAAQRGRCNVTFAEPLLIPTTTGGALTPYGFEVALTRGITFYDGTTETVGLGVYPIQSSKLDGVTLLTGISAIDRTMLVTDARFEDDYAIAAGTDYAAAIQAMIADGVTGLNYAFAAVTYTTPDLVFAAQSDRWATARNMATSIGCELYFDGTGTLVLRPEPTFSGTPLWTLSEGDGGLLIGVDLTLDRAPAYNRVVATGENTSVDAVPRGVWTDDDPSSPTYYFGGFGKKPRFYSSPFITTDGQAVAAAEAIGVSQQGVARSIAFAAVPNPALEPGDPILVVRTAIGLNEYHLIDALTFDLSASGAMTGASRSTGFQGSTEPGGGGGDDELSGFLVTSSGDYLTTDGGDRLLWQG